MLRWAPLSFPLVLAVCCAMLRLGYSFCSAMFLRWAPLSVTTVLVLFRYVGGLLFLLRRIFFCLICYDGLLVAPAVLYLPAMIRWLSPPFYSFLRVKMDCRFCSARCRSALACFGLQFLDHSPSTKPRSIIVNSNVYLLWLRSLIVALPGDLKLVSVFEMIKIAFFFLRNSKHICFLQPVLVFWQWQGNKNVSSKWQSNITILVKNSILIEPRHEKTCLRSERPG